MPKSTNNKKPSKTTVTKSAVTGCFVSSASAAYRYYASHESARNQAVERFEHRMTETSTKPASANKKSRRSA